MMALVAGWRSSTARSLQQLSHWPAGIGTSDMWLHLAIWVHFSSVLQVGLRLRLAAKWTALSMYAAVSFGDTHHLFAGTQAEYISMAEDLHP